MSLKVSVHRKSESGLCCLPRLQYAKRFKLDRFWLFMSPTFQANPSGFLERLLGFQNATEFICIWWKSRCWGTASTPTILPFGLQHSFNLGSWWWRYTRCLIFSFRVVYIVDVVSICWYGMYTWARLLMPLYGEDQHGGATWQACLHVYI